ncbi:sugar O-acetyltransferase [Alloscardovia criceti]|uniref:sugar O-acetyltransferase n=1 Tax=Alloscardovia criceti TaxID=356828 RepID=UPI000366CFCC|nr:sugar O-acetyltransferase [Alloscardovia criceti]
MTDLADTFAFMATGQMYDDLVDELCEARRQAVLATNAYNASYGQPQNIREKLLRELLGSVGEGANFEPTFRCEFGRNIHIGKNFFGNFDCVLLDGAPITIGDNVLFGPKVGLYTSNHALDAQERANGACWAGPITIGNRVWLGANVTVLQNVTIGDDSIIGAGSVVTSDIPAGVIAVGNPAHVIRKITETDRTGYKPIH